MTDDVPGADHAERLARLRARRTAGGGPDVSESTGAGRADDEAAPAPRRRQSPEGPSPARILAAAGAVAAGLGLVAAMEAANRADPPPPAVGVEPGVVRPAADVDAEPGRAVPGPRTAPVAQTRGS